VDYVYDLAGKIKQVTDPTGTYGFAYDNMGRLIGTTTQYSFLPGITYSNAYGYDAASNRTSFTAPDGSTNTYAYDTLGRLSSLTNSLTGQFRFSYDALSRRTGLNRPNGVNTSYSYDSLSRLLNVLHQAVGIFQFSETCVVKQKDRCRATALAHRGCGPGNMLTLPPAEYRCR
jgi:YD repeat-containing protein